MFCSNIIQRDAAHDITISFLLHGSVCWISSLFTVKEFFYAMGIIFLTVDIFNIIQGNEICKSLMYCVHAYFTS